MGITATARTAFKAALSAFRATSPNRAQLRRFVAAVVDAGNEWLSKHDAQESNAAPGFATSRAAQFATYVAALPEVELDDRDDEAPAAAQVK